MYEIYGQGPRVEPRIPDPADRLANEERGLIIPPNGQLYKGTWVGANEARRVELRELILFWDRLEVAATTSTLSFGTDEAFLSDCGILNVAPVTNGSVHEEDLRQARVTLFDWYETHDPGKWSVVGERSVAIFGNERLAESRGILFSLFDAIPVPARDVPLAEILEFKQRRSPELLELRHNLERLYQGISSAPDSHLALSTEMAALDQALARQIRVAKESRFKFRLLGFEAKLDLPTISAAGAAYAAGVQMGLPAATALLAGAGAMAAASFQLTAGLRSGKRTRTPYEYVTSIHRWL